MSALLYNCTTWTLPRRFEKKLGVNYTGMLRVVWNKFLKYAPTKQLLYDHFLSRKTSKKGEQDILCTAGENKDELISDLLRWTPSHGRTSVG